MASSPALSRPHVPTPLPPRSPPCHHLPRTCIQRHQQGATTSLMPSRRVQASSHRSGSFCNARTDTVTGRRRNVTVAAALAEASAASAKLQERGPVVVVDNYDSFTYNLCQYLGNLGCHYVVYRNDDITVEELERLRPRGLLISPGPGTPEDSGISLEVVKTLGPQIPLFGVCMGLQCIGQAFGGSIVRAPQGVMHGKTSPVFHDQEASDFGLLAGLPSPFTACRYHSLVIDRATFPDEDLEITAWTEDGLVMGARHRQFPHLEGVQFHPESVITSNGMDIVRNFLKRIDHFWA